MARARQVTVTSTKAVIAGSTTPGGSNVLITNPTGAADAIFLGGEENELAGPGVTSNTVNSATGYKLAVGSSFGPLRLGGGESLYAIANTATVVVHVFNFGGTP